MLQFVLPGSVLFLAPLTFNGFHRHSPLIRVDAVCLRSGRVMRRNAILGKLTFQFGDALLGVALVHQQMVAPDSRGGRRLRTPDRTTCLPSR
jgi:hypothetical protein